MSSSIPKEEPLEALLVQLGGFSRFQWWACFVIFSPEVMAAMTAMLPIFIGVDSQNNGIVEDVVGDGAWGRRSLVDEWDLRGGRAWVTEMFTSVFMAGMMIGAIINSILADRVGRKDVFFTLIFILGVCGSAAAFTRDPYTYALTRFFAGFAVGGYYCIYGIFLMEYLTPKWRIICGSISFWFLGEMTLAVGAYFVQSWRLLSFISAAPALLFLLNYPFIPETPRWLFCHGKFEEGKLALDKIAKWNRKPEIAHCKVAELQKRFQMDKGDDGSFSILWGSSRLMIQLSIFLVIWFSIGFTYYGITFNTKNLSGDPIINMVYLGIVDVAAGPVGVIFSNCFGRRRAISLLLFLTPLFLGSLVLLGSTTSIFEENGQWITLFSFLARFGAAAAWGVLVCFTAESFPTVIRSTSVGICCFVGNMGGTFAPQMAFVAQFWPEVPNTVFATLTGVSIAMIWMQKDMAGKPLADLAV